MVAGGGFSDIQKQLKGTTEEIIKSAAASKQDAEAKREEAAAAKKLADVQKAIKAQNKVTAKNPAMQFAQVSTTFNNALKKKGAAPWSFNMARFMPPGRQLTNLAQNVPSPYGAGKVLGAPPKLGAFSPLYSPWNPAMGGVSGKLNKYPQPPQGFVAGSNIFSKFFNSMQKNNSTFQKWHKNMFRFQMATLGLAFSFGGLESTVEGVLSKLGDLGGTFTGSALGSKFGGVDVQGLSGTSNDQLIQGWKNFQGIVGMVDTALRIIAADMLTPDVMKAIQDFFKALAPVLPQIAEPLGKLAKSAVDFLAALLPYVPTLAKILDVLSPILGPLLVMVILLGQLLPLFSAIGYIFEGLALVAPIIAPLSGAIVGLFAGISAPMVLIAGIGIILIDLIRNLWDELSKGQDILSAFYYALVDTWNDIASLIKTITGGLLDLTVAKGNSSGYNTSTTHNNNATTYNINTLNLNSNNASLNKLKNNVG